MVVVVLIALTVSLVGLTFDRDVDQVAALEARRFAQLIEHIRDESILSGKIYAIEVDEQAKTYGFLESAGEWAPVRQDDILRQRRFPEYLTIRFEVLQTGDEGSQSLLVVQSSGEITPFQLTVAGEKFINVVSLDDSLDILVNQVSRDEG